MVRRWWLEKAAGEWMEDRNDGFKVNNSRIVPYCRGEHTCGLISSTEQQYAIEQ